MTRHAFALTFAAALALAGCKNQPQSNSADAPKEPPAQAAAPAPTPAPAAAPAPAAEPAEAAPAPARRFMADVEAGKPLWATLQTNMGDITVQLYVKEAPKTVANFVGLATGEKEWTDPRTGQKMHRPLYMGTVFHRVIPGFMIQGGDPLGTGMGDPGYRFEDEFNSPRVFDHPGILAMANAGPNTNGSQFFITVRPTPHLNKRHTIFGDVVAGYDVVEKIANTPRDSGDRPLSPVILKGINIVDPDPKR